MRLFAFVGSLLVLALLAALIVPGYVDWNQFKSRFEEGASLTLGLPVIVRGQASARLLPLPSVTFTDVEIGDTGDNLPLLVASSFKIDVELAPLLKGNVVVVDMKLSSPTVNLVLDQQGQISVPEIADRRPELLNANVSLDNISVADGQLLVVDSRTGQTMHFLDIDAIASAKSLSGPWRVNGGVTRNGEKFRIGLVTGSWQDEGQIRLTMKVEPRSLPYDFEFNGPLLVQNAVPTWKGKMEVSRMGDQSAEELITFRRPGREAALPLRLESELEIASGGATVPSFELDIGASDDPYTLSGSGQVVFGEDVSFRLRAEGQQVNVERFDVPTESGIDFGRRLALFRSFLSSIPQFDADGEINLFLPAVVAGDTVIREVGMDLRPTPLGGGWEINNLEAQLPGRTDLRADGQLTLGETFGYRGELILASKQPSGFAKWLGAKVSPAIRDLTVAGFSANAMISGDLVEFDNVEIVLDQEVLKGSIRREKIGSERPNLVAVLAGDAVNFEQLNSLFALFSGGDGQTLMTEHDLDLNLQARSMAAFGLKADDVIVRVSSKKDLLRIDQLDIANMANAAINVSGQIETVEGRPVGRLSTRIVSDDPSEFLQVIDKRFGPYPLVGRIVGDPETVRSTELVLDFEGHDSGYSLTAVGRSGGSDIDAKLNGNDLSLPLNQQSIEGQAVIDNADAAKLLLQMGIPVVPLHAIGRGAFRLAVDGIAEQGLQTEGTLTMAGGFVSGSGTVKPSVNGDRVTIDGLLKVKSELDDIDPAILLSGLPLPGFGECRSANLTTMLAVNGPRYQVRDLKGAIGDSRFEGELKLDASRQPRPRVLGTLKVSELDASKIAALVYTGIPLADAGSGADNEEGDQPALSGLDGEISLTSESMHLFDDYPDAQDLSALIQLRDGDIALEELTANWLGGSVTGEIALAQSTASRAMNGQFVLARSDLDLVSRLAALPAGLNGKLTIGGAFETAGRDAGSMLSQMTASGTLEIEGGTLTGLNSGAFRPLLRAADAIDDEALGDQATNLLAAEIPAGRFDFGTAGLPFNVTAGVLRITNLTLANDEAKVVGTGRYELSSAAAEFDANVEFEPGKEVVVGASPEFDIAVSVAKGKLTYEFDSGLFSTYLGMRVSERREREFEAQRSEILERQRLQQIARIYVLKAEAKRIAEEERERIRLLELEQEEQRRREHARRVREELERKRIESEIISAEKRAARESALEAGRRARRQEEIDLLRAQAKEAAERIRLDDYATEEKNN